MRLLRWVLPLLLAFPAFAQTFTGATVKTVDASRGMREPVAAARTPWVAWTVPTSRSSIRCSWSEGTGTRCGGCSLEGRGLSIDDDAVGTQRTTTMLLAARVTDGRIGRMRAFDAECPIAAAGASVTLLTGVTAEASLDFLVQSTRESEDDELLAVLSLHDHPKVVPALIELARNDPSTHVRRGAIFWLSQKAGVRAAAELRHAVDHDPMDEVREHAVFAISQLPHDRAVPMLIDLVNTHKSRKVRERAMFWLAQTDDPRALDLIESILTR